MTDLQRRREFTAEATSQQDGLVMELIGFLAHTKKWWLTPIILVLLLMGAIIALGGTAAAPFIYTLF